MQIDILPFENLVFMAIWEHPAPAESTVSKALTESTAFQDQPESLDRKVIKVNVVKMEQEACKVLLAHPEE